jgi:hypothetical protein
MFLETQMDEKRSSERTQIPFMKEFFGNFQHVNIMPREVHSRADLQKFLKQAKKDRSIKALHVVAHGERTHEASNLVLTGGERVDLGLPENQSLFEGLNGKDHHVEAIFFSACQLGRRRTLMRTLLDASGVDAIFSYRRDVDDYQAFIIESLFYHLTYGHLIGRRSFPALDAVYNTLVQALHDLRVDRKRGPSILAAEFRWS